MTEKQARRFWQRVEFRPDGCWFWTGPPTTNGYGQVGLRPKVYRPHVLLWTEFHGEQPKGLHLHHTCGNKLCVNPGHLQLLTPKEHVYEHHRERNPQFDTHCKRGHTREGNTYYRPSGGPPICRPCQNEIKRLKRVSERASTIYV